MEAQKILKAHIAKIVTITDEQFDYVFSHFKKKSFHKGQAIITEGDLIDCEYFVISGCLKSFFIMPSSAIASGFVDFVLSAKKIGQKLSKINIDGNLKRD